MLINTSKSAVKNMIDLINFDNSTALTSAEITLGAPSEFIDGEGLNDRNSQVTVSAVPASGYSDSVDIRYYRLDLDQLRGVRVLEHTKTEATTVQSIIDAISTTVDLIETELELLDENGVVLNALVPLDGPKAYSIRAVAASLCYIGEMEVTVNPIVVPEVPVGDEVQTTDMSGFDYPAE